LGKITELLKICFRRRDTSTSATQISHQINSKIHSSEIQKRFGHLESFHKKQSGNHSTEGSETSLCFQDQLCLRKGHIHQKEHEEAVGSE
jgi:hypothetical protein